MFPSLNTFINSRTEKNQITYALFSGDSNTIEVQGEEIKNPYLLRPVELSKQLENKCTLYVLRPLSLRTRLRIIFFTKA